MLFYCRTNKFKLWNTGIVIDFKTDGHWFINRCNSPQEEDYICSNNAFQSFSINSWQILHDFYLSIHFCYLPFPVLFSKSYFIFFGKECLKAALPILKVLSVSGFIQNKIEPQITLIKLSVNYFINHDFRSK